MIRLAILGSGNGTNAQQITEYFAGRQDVEVVCIIYNVKDAYIAQRAQNLGIEARYFGRKDFYENDSVLNYLHEIEALNIWLIPVLCIGFIYKTGHGGPVAFVKHFVVYINTMAAEKGIIHEKNFCVVDTLILIAIPKNGVTLFVFGSFFQHG